MATTFLLLTLQLAAGEARADPLAYSSPPIRGRVVDQETEAPLAGVIVVALWRLDRMVFPGEIRFTGDVLHVAEAVTDDIGHYTLPAWGPKARPAFTHMQNETPRLLYFKMGYYPDWRSNPIRSYENRDQATTRVSIWDGKPVGLRAFKPGVAQEYREYPAGPLIKWSGTWAEYGDALDELQGKLGWADYLHYTKGHWKGFPRMILALEEARVEIKKHGASGPSSLDSIDGKNGAEVREFLRLEGRQ